MAIFSTAQDSEEISGYAATKRRSCPIWLISEK